MGDLKKLLLGQTTEGNPAVTPPVIQSTRKPVRTESEIASLAARKKVVDDYVQMYTAGFSAPGFNSSAHGPSDNEKVVLVTGASGSLGSNLVHHIAALLDVKQVVCLNREKKRSHIFVNIRP